MGSSRDHRLDQGESFLEGKLLIALPGMEDERFAQTVIYMCAHSSKGAMGIVINKPIPGLSFSELMKQLDIRTTPMTGEYPICTEVRSRRVVVLFCTAATMREAIRRCRFRKTFRLPQRSTSCAPLRSAEARTRRCLRSVTRAGHRVRLSLNSRGTVGFIARPTLRSFLALSQTQNGARHCSASALARPVLSPIPGAPDRPGFPIEIRVPWHEKCLPYCVRHDMVLHAKRV